MKYFILILFTLTHLGLISQNSGTKTEKNENYLSEQESEILHQMFSENNQEFDFSQTKIAFVGGATGNIILTRKKFFKDFVYPVVENNKKNVCALIVFTDSEKNESGGFDGIILTPAKIFTSKHKQKLIRKLKRMDSQQRFCNCPP